MNKWKRLRKSKRNHPGFTGPEHSPAKKNWSKKQVIATSITLSVIASGVIPFQTADALTRVTSDSGTVWEIHDVFAPSLDTGSLRTVGTTQVQGFGNIFVKVSSPSASLMNGQMMRGFNLKYDGVNTFTSAQSVNLGNVTVTREVYVDTTLNRTRFFDTFTNKNDIDVKVDVSFGGSLGYGTTANASVVKATYSEDLEVTTEDSWIVVDSSARNNKPLGVAVGSPHPFDNGLTGLGNQQQNPFTTPLAKSGNEANFYGFINTLNIRPGESKSLVHYVQVGEAGEAGLNNLVTMLNGLNSHLDVSGLSNAQIRSISNWDISGIEGLNTGDSLVIPDAPAAAALVTSSPYDVTNKSIAEMQQDMVNGKTTSVQITQAYLDRIKAYDEGQLGFHAFLHVSETALNQAKAADAARAQGAKGDLLGIPIAIKDIYDTKDMPTTGGSKALEGWQPESDAFQVNKLREAGAVIIGKVNTSEFANSGSFSESGWLQTWNALYPSKTSFGSSGGSAVSVAADFAAAAMGSQTGVSLYAPTTGSSLKSFRGTDGMASTTGVLPLTWGQDYAGPIAKTVTDLAIMLNATTGTDPQDIFTVTADADHKRPADWKESLDSNALQGKKIGYIPASFVSTYADDDTGQAVMNKFSELQAAGATMVEMSALPAAPSRPSGINGSTEGWARYIELHKDFPYLDGASVLASDKVLIYNQRSYTAPVRMTEQAVQDYIKYRTDYKEVIKGWMDANGVDAVVYAGFISDVYNNDASASQLSSDRGTGVLTSNVGLPTVVVPVGTNDSGYSISMQLVGRAWDDANVLGMGYALEQQSQARLLTAFAPALQYVSPPVTPDPGTDGPSTGGGTVTPTPTPTPMPTPTTEPTSTSQPEVVSFADTMNHWAWASIDTLIAKGLLTGYSDGTFRPNAGLTRAEAIKVIATYMGLEGQASNFKDVSTAHWASKYIGAAAGSGLMNGYSDGSFRPDQKISRSELAALITRAFKLTGTGNTTFKDVNRSAWYYDSIDALASNKIITGYADSTFKPQQEITRAEFATMVSRLLETVN
ncbi:amidase family protein [Paenibacillus sp. MMS20-IR301]|uniref:amidase family protein n=1 Tax=Paenibacillus sp. MMS20-IR301 TaxID=2895946 RepID=UPI0028E9D768|nr:amidase family protein [Paenibacillus sp. MMS20-IR301]WNS40806.1 amidase family protein [Paenibacillus sp. MMS20-IR301]